MGDWVECDDYRGIIGRGVWQRLGKPTPPAANIVIPIVEICDKVEKGIAHISCTFDGRQTD
jgi:hypothetical protein